MTKKPIIISITALGILITLTIAVLCFSNDKQETNTIKEEETPEIIEKDENIEPDTKESIDKDTKEETKPNTKKINTTKTLETEEEEQSGDQSSHNSPSPQPQVQLSEFENYYNLSDQEKLDFAKNSFPSFDEFIVWYDSVKENFFAEHPISDSSYPEGIEIAAE